ncbi:MAG TPA: tetratricopeptide repeat protein [Terriglobales bacterium]|nr:tetratricopeptide repeat protein [Terriglobales bacterium]
MPAKVSSKKQAPEDPRHVQAVKSYEDGLRALQEQKFEKAKASLQKALGGPDKALVDRAQVHIRTCDQHLEAPTLHFKNTEEHFDYAISLMNTGDYVMAQEHFEKLLKQEPKADYVLYGMAALHCLTGRVEESLKTLDQAIQANAALRFQARNDADFQNLTEDPRFTELLYPDPGAEEVETPTEETSAY